MIEPLYAFLTAIVLVFAIAVHPQRAQCPPRWHVEGVRPSGAFVCLRNPIGDDHRNARGILIDDSVQAPGRLEGVIYCGDGVPIVDDDRSVRCMPRDFVSNGWR
jgi:hypothetical protein